MVTGDSFWSDKSSNLQLDIGKSTEATSDADMPGEDVCLFWGGDKFNSHASFSRDLGKESFTHTDLKMKLNPK